MQSLHRQRGVTAIGWIIILGLIAFFSLVIIRVIPAYTEYFSVVTSLESVANESGLAEKPRHEIMKLIDRRFQINDVRTIKPKDVLVTKKGSRVELSTNYNVTKPLFGNISIIINFQKVVEG